MSSDSLKKNDPWDITPEPTREFEVRVVVYNTHDIPAMDIEGTSDVFFTDYIDNKNEKVETDTHYRCMTGDASFNYRLIIPYS